ncbi:cytochrome c [Rhodobacterales bacterium HKCCE4037]|nr:cytochrome c [Rhodobacterales bacterium HKCCE4037]
MSLSRILIATALTGAVALPALAQESNPAVNARQGHMQVLALNLGVVGNMARGNTDYDPEAAQAAADNLLMMSQINQRFYWPEGTDSESIEGTRALPAIWEEGSQVMEISAELVAATEGLAAVAGDGLDAMRGALGPVGGACGACHDDYRVSN